MKKLIAVTLIIAIAFTFIACGNHIPANSDNLTDTENITDVVDDTTEPTINPAYADKIELYIKGKKALVESAGYPYEWSGRDLSKWYLHEIEPAWQWQDVYCRWVYWPVQIDENTLLVDRRDGQTRWLEEWTLVEGGLVKVNNLGELPSDV